MATVSALTLFSFYHLLWSLLLRESRAWMANTQNLQDRRLGKSLMYILVIRLVSSESAYAPKQNTNTAQLCMVYRLSR